MIASSGQPLVAETLARMDDAWSEFHKRVHALPGQAIEEAAGPGAGAWTRKQMLGHIATWHERTVEAISLVIETDAVPADPEDTDMINARAARAAVGRTAGEVLAGMDDSFRQVRRAVARLTDEQLSGHDGWITAMIAGNTYDHYPEHLPDLPR